jgi:hypothetical protein
VGFEKIQVHQSTKNGMAYLSKYLLLGMRDVHHSPPRGKHGIVGIKFLFYILFCGNISDALSGSSQSAESSDLP